jgi:hypothetical protein
MFFREDDDLIGIGVRQRAKQHAVNDREDSSVDADREREREKRCQRESRRAQHQAHGMTEILNECGHRLLLTCRRIGAAMPRS